MYTPPNRSQAKELFFTPTLVIGLGGTGQRVVRRLKQKVATAISDFPLIRFLAIDTDTGDNPPDETPLSDRELLLLAGFNPRDVLRDLDLPGFAPLRARLPKGMSSPQATQRLSSYIHVGTQQNRIVSVIGLYLRFGKVQAALQGAIEDVTSMADALRTSNLNVNGFKARLTRPTDAGLPFQVFIVSSLGGGTGSGLFLDIAYLCRHYLRGHIAQIHGIFVLPPVVELAVRRVSTVQRERIRANTYAALLELDALGERSRWNFPYPEGLVTDISAPPFDFCYLIDKANEFGQGFMDAETVWENTAQALLDCISPSISQYLGTFYGNTEILTRYFPGYGDAQNKDSRDRRQAYSSFIAGSIALPLQQLKDYFGARLALETLGQSSSLSTGIGQGLLERNTAFLGRVLPVQGSIQELTSGMRVPPWSGAATQDANTALTQAVEQENSDRRFIQSAERTIADHQQELQRSAAEKLHLYAESLLKDVGAGGALRALDLLSGAEPVPNPDLKTLRCSFRHLSVAVGKIDTLESAKRAYETQRAVLNRLAAQGVGGKLRRGWSKISGGFDPRSLSAAREQRMSLELQSLATSALATVYTQMAEEARALHASLEVVYVALGHCQNCLDDDRNALSQGNSVPGSPVLEPNYEMGISVLSVPDMEEIYQDLAQDTERKRALEIVQELVAAHSLEDFKTLAQGATNARDLATRYRQDCARIFEDRLQQLNVLDLLARRHPDRSPQQVIGEAIMDIRQLAVPLWRYDRNRLTGELEHLAIIAVSDTTDPRIPEVLRDNAQHFQLRSTNTPWRVDILHIRHGVPVGLLYDAAEWQQAYERNSKSPVPLHIIPDMEFPDIIPPDVAPRVSGGERAFAVGLAFGWIVCTGNNRYFVDPQREYTTKKIVPPSEHFMGHGRSQAMEAISRNHNWVAQIERLLDKEILAESQPVVVEKLNKAIDQLEDGLRQVSPTGDLAEQYRKEINQLKQCIEDMS